jgi:hydrogenase/urease accessory protein HupE
MSVVRKLRVLAGAGSVALCLTTTTCRAHAHEVGLSQGTYTLRDGSVKAELVFTNAELATSIPELDLNSDLTLSREELKQGSKVLKREIASEITMKANGALCTGSFDDADLTERDGVRMQAHYSCALEGQPTRIDATFNFLTRFPAGHKHLAALSLNGQTVSTLANLAAPTASLEGHAANAQRSTLSIIRVGVEHILTGYDHLAFLLGLILLADKLRTVLAMVTAFTLAHSITLACAALGYWTPSPAIVEPAIALSIVYVAAENLWSLRTKRTLVGRWKITLPFGLIHGFGFAGALRELHVEHSFALVLGCFNLGVELGQLAVLALFWSALCGLRKWPAFRSHGALAISALIGLAGLVWFVLRIKA